MTDSLRHGDGDRSGDSEEPRTVDIWRSSVSAARPCRGCGASILFAQRVGSEAGKLTPFRAPLTILERRGEALVIVDSNHFIDCPEAKAFRVTPVRRTTRARS
jgi:hypothetical protein